MTYYKKHTAWAAPSNIALVKYWGKHGIQLPANASLSFSLSESRTETFMEISDYSADPLVTFYFEGKPNDAFGQRVRKYLESLQDYIPGLLDHRFHFISRNTFPHSAGIASSASAFASIALCLTEAFTRLPAEERCRFASGLARLGSGSAARSVYGSYAVWGTHVAVPGSSDLYAVPYTGDIHPVFRQIHDTILIGDDGVKKVSSSQGHKLMVGHPFAAARFQQAAANLTHLGSALKTGDWDRFSRIVETEALSLHSMMMTSAEPYLLINPATLHFIEKIREARSNGTMVCFTLDAGPNVHMLYPESELNKIGLIIDEVKQFCQKGIYISDRIGHGPYRINQA